MTSVKRQIFESLKNPTYRSAFVNERVRSSVALQIRALREQRNGMTQKQLGDAVGMAQTWVSKLENPDYGKMTVATLLRLAKAFDTDLEIKFRPFSETIDTLPAQGPEYFSVPNFAEEESNIEANLERESAPINQSASASQTSFEMRPPSQQSTLIEGIASQERFSLGMANVIDIRAFQQTKTVSFKINDESIFQGGRQRA